MKKEFIVATALALATLCAVGFAVDYVLGANIHYGGALLGGAFIFLAAGMVVWEHELMKHDETVEEMAVQRSHDADRAASDATFAAGARTVVGRRGWLVKMLAGAVGTIGVAFLFPLHSFSRKYGRALEHTSWTPGARLVREDGTPVMASDLEVNSILTVFPEGHVGPSHSDVMATDATVLIRVPPDELALPADRAGWGPQGLVAYSKVCTHAGCPVALYRASERQLFCPCHQSTFDVLRGGERIFGPAARGLPQLPIAIAADGSVHATGDFPEPIGPGYWDRA